jgi:hypothetical protein
METRIDLVHALREKKPKATRKEIPDHDNERGGRVEGISKAWWYFNHETEDIRGEEPWYPYMLQVG